MSNSSKKENCIKVGFCVAYDWHLLKKALPRVYKSADAICLSLDKNRKSWAGNPYEFDEQAFYQFVEEIDTQHKIILYEDDFACAHISPYENENRQRNLIAKKLSPGGWHIQIDVDEYFLDFDAFVAYLKKIHPHPSGHEKPLNVCANWISLIKKVDQGYLYVKPTQTLPEQAPFASNVPQYEAGRNNGHFNITSPFYVIHETWAREDQELWYKLHNWGHSGEEFSTQQQKQSYYNFWKALDANNFQYVRDFHPTRPAIWPALGFSRGETIEEFIQHFEPPPFPLSQLQLRLKNNRNLARLRALYQKINPA